MPVFLLLSGCLALGVVAVLVRPLWRDARGVALGVAGLVLASTAALYAWVGTPRALAPATPDAPLSLPQAIAELEAALRADPRQAEGWRLLAQAYSSQGRAADARDALTKAIALVPDDMDLLVQAAQARALADPSRRFDGEAIRMLEQVLARDGSHQRARWFLGIARRQAGANAEAAALWEPMLAQVDGPAAASLRREIDAARAAAGLAPLAADAATPSAPVPPGRSIEVRVALDPDFAARVRLDGNASVFVIARAPGGPPMPVAVEKRRVAELPLTVRLDDDDSPMPTARLSQLATVEVLARLSSSGTAQRADGDIESAPVRVALPASAPVELRIGAR